MSRSASVIIILLIIILGACNGEDSSTAKKDGREIFSGEKLANTKNPVKKYQIKSGYIIYITTMNTRSIDLSFKTKVYFDNFGLKERRDIYEGGELIETFLCDGEYNYNISHVQRTIDRTGNAYRGTEPKFGWEDISEEDIISGKVIRNPPVVIATKECRSYSVKTGLATATYAGWQDIVLLSEITSAGGTSRMIAQELQTSAVNPRIFSLPEGYERKD